MPNDKSMPKVGDLVLVSLPHDDEIECQVKAVWADQVEIEWPQSSDDGGWVTSRSSLTRNPDGTWNALLPARPDDVHPAARPLKRG